ncbi:MAG: DUF4912 domain-containing protein [Elusimicrobiales bacterium]|nr:DUF4912 domain-containing protein [Elusimicrobiales bacterium]
MNNTNGSKDSGSKESAAQNANATEAALMPRDSNWMFACWHIAEEQKKELADKMGEDFFKNGRLALRVHDITSKNVFDSEVLPEAESWYVNVPEGGHEYFCEIGYKIKDSFESLAKTNTVKLPPANLTGIIGEKIQTVSGGIEKLIKAGADRAGVDSNNLAKRWEMLRAVFAPNIDERAAEIAEGKREKEKAEKEKRKVPLWLIADCELVIFGATEKDASITIGGRKIVLNPDGTFNARFSLPDGPAKFEVKAESADKAQQKTVAIETTRKTEK